MKGTKKNNLTELANLSQLSSLEVLKKDEIKNKNTRLFISTTKINWVRFSCLSLATEDINDERIVSKNIGKLFEEALDLFIKKNKIKISISQEDIDYYMIKLVKSRFYKLIISSSIDSTIFINNTITLSNDTFLYKYRYIYHWMHKKNKEKTILIQNDIINELLILLEENYPKAKDIIKILMNARF